MATPQPPADFFVPDVGQRIDATGRVTYDFAGHVHAQGVDLDTGLGGAGPLTPADRRVQWLAPDGSRWGSIYDDGMLNLDAEDVGGDSGIQLLAGVDGGLGGTASLSVLAGGPAGAEAFGADAAITMGVSDASGLPGLVTLFDSFSRSIFVKRYDGGAVSNADIRFNFGVDVAYDQGSGASGVLRSDRITHGLACDPAEPAIVGALVTGAAFFNLRFVGAEAVNGVAFTGVVQADPGIDLTGASARFAWLAAAEV